MRKIVLLGLILIAFSSMAVAEPEINISQSSDTFDSATNEPVEMNVSTNLTDVEDMVMYSNETGDFESHQVYTETIDTANNTTTGEFEWTNENNVLEQENISYYFEIEDEETYTSENRSFDFEIYPVIQNVSYEEEIDSEEIMEIDADILHPIGSGRLESTEIVIETPSDKETTVSMRDTEEVEDDHLTGNTYRGSFGQTTEEGEYTATIKARDEYREVEKEIEFEVENGGAAPSGTRLSPAYIGQSSIAGSLNMGELQSNVYAQIFGGLLALSTLIVAAAVLGGAGTEENDFTDYQDPDNSKFGR